MKGIHGAEQAIERWEEDIERAASPIEPTGLLQRLLREHHEISEAIMDIRDQAVSRMYYYDSGDEDY